MKTVTLPDGTQAPALGQGTWYLGEQPAVRARELAALRTGIEHGMTLLDTAEMYGGGRSEELVGEAIRPYDREKLFLVSKVYPHNAGRPEIFRSCENSLRRLGTEYLDLYLLHWRGSVPFAETAECMEELVRKGRIRRWGVSNLDTDDMEELWGVPGGAQCQADQVLYHLGSRGVEYDLLPWLARHRVAMMAYCPLAQGGALRRGLLESGALRAVARRHGVTEAQALLAFVLDKPGVVAIPRTGSALHAQENAAAATIVLTDEDRRQLDEAFPPPREKAWLDIV